MAHLPLFVQGRKWLGAYTFAPACRDLAECRSRACGLYDVRNHCAAEIQKAVIKPTLHCDHCKQRETCGLKFNTEMLKIKGVKMYELDDKKMTFTIYYNPKKTDLQAIKVAISKLGYDADEVKATSEGSASLDGCCKA